MGRMRWSLHSSVAAVVRRPHSPLPSSLHCAPTAYYFARAPNRSRSQRFRSIGSAAEETHPLYVRFAYHQVYGFDKIPGGAADGEERKLEMSLFTKAMSYVLSADGDVSPEEAFYAKGFLASKGCPAWVMDLVDEYAAEALAMSPEQVAAEIKDILTKTPHIRPAGPAILHAALSAAAADGLNDAEVAQSVNIAGQFGMSEEEVQTIVGIVNEETALRHRRIRAFYPGGYHPCLMSKFCTMREE